MCLNFSSHSILLIIVFRFGKLAFLKHQDYNTVCTKQIKLDHDCLHLGNHLVQQSIHLYLSEYAIRNVPTWLQCQQYYFYKLTFGSSSMKLPAHMPQINLAVLCRTERCFKSCLKCFLSFSSWSVIQLPFSTWSSARLIS